MKGISKDKAKPSFEEAYAELQGVLKELGGQGVPLDELVEKYARAKRCLEICRERLSEAEMRVKILSENGEEDFPKH